MKTRKFLLPLIVLTGAAALLSLSYPRSRSLAPVKPVNKAVEPVKVIAGPGRVEPSSEDIKLGSEASGKLRSVNVEEGARIHKGEVLAVLENDEFQAQVASATAELEVKQASLRKVLNGAAPAERLEALAKVRAAEAVLATAQNELQRRQRLFDERLISREELERYSREFQVAKEQLQENEQHYARLDGAPREEDVAVAEAEVALARAHLADAEAKCEKTMIKSPIDGVVLRKHHRVGESVSNSATTPDPVLTVGDTRVLCVRVDIDETDVDKVHQGQKAYVMADAYPGKKFWGRVVRIGELLGPKTVRTDQPTEQVDRKFLEAIVELASGVSLPMGLRVDTFVETDGRRGAARSAN